jgi:zinc and cadmium transporter
MSLSPLIYISLFSSALISGLSVLFVKINQRNLKLLLSFSGSFLFAICVLHLIPEVYIHSTPSTGIFILAGFFLQILLDFFSEGIEHGHIHIHKLREKAFPLSMMVGLSIHSFLEGMPLAESFNQKQLAQSLLIGIILHNIPIAIALMSMLLQSNIRKNTAILMLIIFALTAPLGTLAGNIIGNNAVSLTFWFNAIMGIVIGIFLHISTTILFESNENHSFNFVKFLTIICGAAVAFFLN